MINLAIYAYAAISLLLIAGQPLTRVQAYMPEGAVAAGEVVSYCAGYLAAEPYTSVVRDAPGADMVPVVRDAPGAPSLLAIASPGGTTDTGEPYGKFLLICGASAKAYLDVLGYIPAETIEYRIDLSGIKPMKVQLGDVNGDGVPEIAVCAYKTAKFHPVMAKRPFFFDFVGGNLVPVWLGSRLSRPFDDYVLCDMDGDGSDEIVSIERLENGDRAVAVYKWRGFGFEALAETGAMRGKPQFCGTARQMAMSTVILLEGKKLAIKLDGDKFTYN